jgi:hypothetical protein
MDGTTAECVEDIISQDDFGFFAPAEVGDKYLEADSP